MSIEIKTPEDILSLSDEELMQLDPSQFPTEEASSDENTDADEANEASANEAQAEAGNEAEEAEEAEGSEESQAEETVNSAKESTDEGEQQQATQQKSEKSAETLEDKKPQGNEIDYKAVYEQIFAPFKANGREISANSVDDVIALMQMGANYNKKMAGLKPSLKIQKLLENNGLLDEEKLNYLIDLDKKNPEAIQKLLKDANIDPLEIDTHKESNYKPTQRVVSEKQIELDEVLERIQETSTFGKVVNLVQREWDDKSRQIIAENPGVLEAINAHMATGVFDLITAEMSREKMFGRLTGLSDLEAYKVVGDAIEARGGFAALAQNKESSVNTKGSQPTPPAKKVSEAVRNEKRRAASPVAAVPKASSKEPDFNPLALSDEEFLKLVSKQY